jgi:hypothetical protein
MLHPYHTDLPGQPSSIIACLFSYSRLKQRMCGDELGKLSDVVRVSTCRAATHIEWMSQRGSCTSGIVQDAGHFSVLYR